MADDDHAARDVAGLRRLQEEAFIRHGDALFLASRFDRDVVERAIAAESPRDVQRRTNRVHLFPYAADLAVQRRWAYHVEWRWAVRFRAEFPDLATTIEKVDDGREVTVTFHARKK